GPLQELDLVAYLRFASVYRAFDSLEDFEAAIAELREDTGPPATDDEDRAEAVGGDEAVAGSQEDDRGPRGTAQVPEPAHAAD
ncbi:transcriptional regulator NrdR, partial [Streptomyces sp. WSLK1-4]